jgi:hypothetical protein
MYIQELIDVSLVKDREVYVKATAEDCKVLYRQTYLDPEEYGSAEVETFISTLDIEEYYDMDIPDDKIEEYAKEYLKDINYDLDWRVIENDY